jgi:hypothetical protein
MVIFWEPRPAFGADDGAFAGGASGDQLHALKRVSAGLIGFRMKRSAARTGVDTSLANDLEAERALASELGGRGRPHDGSLPNDDVEPRSRVELELIAFAQDGDRRRAETVEPHEGPAGLQHQQGRFARTKGERFEGHRAGPAGRSQRFEARLAFQLKD